MLGLLTESMVGATVIMEILEEAAEDEGGIREEGGNVLLLAVPTMPAETPPV